ncbi:SRR1-like protein [Polyodon spathula]|uniref:SRR1-like protein n=1 Tax=Polyodon spathula TaxID=7913 RepID=UPI001B7E9CC2|nr:SRR1-like protein [Polyodon spathula]XP_041095958.1 SRR1-like protein [Polyodon spathula]
MTGNAGEWQTVRKRRGAGKAGRQQQDPGPSRQCGRLQDEAPDSHRIKERIQGAVDELRTAEFWDACKKLTLGCLMKSLHTGAEEAGDTGAPARDCQDCKGTKCPDNAPDPPIPAADCAGPSPDPPIPAADCAVLCPAGAALDCVCYGLGRFSSCASSRYQLALLLLLLESLQIPASRCYLYDPMFSKAEVGILEDFGMTVLTKNEEGKRPAHRPTLFYLIHCGKALYNNLLWKNWSVRGLSQLTVIGNSFRGIEERLLARVLQRDYKYISDMLEVVREVPFPDSPRYLEIFNDTSVHCFPTERLRALPPALWDSPAEPDYQEDLEIIRAGEGGSAQVAAQRTAL